MLLKIFGPSALLFLVAIVIVYEQRINLPFEDYEKTRELAVLLCSEKMAEQPTLEFSTDGCTLWPEGFNAESNWSACCVRHDVDYWCGGTAEERVTADNTYRECVKQKNGMMGVLMFYSSRLLGHPMLPTPWRFGWGHNEYPRGYEPKSSSGTNTDKNDAASTTPN